MNKKRGMRALSSLLGLIVMVSFWSMQRVAAQQTSTLNNPVYLLADEMPAFPGRDEALQKYFDDNLNFKIEDAYKFVTISFIVKADGKVTDVRMVKGLAHPTTPEMDSTVVQVARKMPLWKPGLINEKPVNTRLLFPVRLQ